MVEDPLLYFQKDGQGTGDGERDRDRPSSNAMAICQVAGHHLPTQIPRFQSRWWCLSLEVFTQPGGKHIAPRTVQGGAAIVGFNTHKYLPRQLCGLCSSGPSHSGHVHPVPCTVYAGA